MRTATLIQRIETTYAQLQRAGHLGMNYPEPFKGMVASYVHHRRERGDSWKEITARIPVSSKTARTWMRQSRPGTMVPVVVSIPSTPAIPTTSTITASTTVRTLTPALVVISPNGFQLSGLDLMQAVKVLGLLG